jgi:cytochrome c6
MTSYTNRVGWWMAFVLCSLWVFAQLPARADDAAAKLYQTKCVACHAADGGGNTTVGKALKIADLRDPEVQKQSDADLTMVIAKGKNKMPAYEKTLKPEEIKGLVAYVRSLASKK